jgi:polyphosphate glucokinase
LGSYEGGKMLFLGLGTGLGTTLIANGVVEPMELGHLPYKKGTYEDYVGRAGLERSGKKKWRRHVADVVERLMAALRPDETVIGGGNVKKLDALPWRCRAGENANVFRGGFRLWAGTEVLPSKSAARTGSKKKRKARNMSSPTGLMTREPSLAISARASTRPTRRSSWRY